VPSQLLHISRATESLQQEMLKAGVAKNLSSMGAQELLFAAQLPALGYATFYVRASASPSANAAAASAVRVLRAGVGPVALDSGAVTVTLDDDSGLLSSLAASDGSWNASVAQVGPAWLVRCLRCAGCGHGWAGLVPAPPALLGWRAQGLAAGRSSGGGGKARASRPWPDRRPPPPLPPPLLPVAEAPVVPAFQRAGGRGPRPRQRRVHL
jgi:hypothetical protein